MFNVYDEVLFFNLFYFEQNLVNKIFRPRIESNYENSTLGCSCLSSIIFSSAIYVDTLVFLRSKIWTTRFILRKRVSHKTTPCFSRRFVCMPFLERGEKPIYRNLLREKTPKSYYNHDGYYLSPFMFTQNTFVLTFHILRTCPVHILSKKV